MQALGHQRGPRLLRFWLRDWGGRLAFGLCIYSALYAVWTTQHWGGPPYVQYIAHLAFIPVTVTAALLAFRTASHPALDLKTRSAWRTIGFSLVVFWLGGMLRALHELIRGSAVFPSAADLAHVIAYPVLFLALMRFPRRRMDEAERARFWIDVLVVVLGGGAIIWYLMLGPAASWQPAGLLPSGLAAFYPIGDLALVFALAAVLLGRAEGLSTPPFLVLLASLLTFVAADLQYSYQTLEGTYRSGGWIDAVYIIGLALPGVAAYLHYQQAWRPELPRQTARAGWGLPARFPYGMIAISSALFLLAARAESGQVLMGIVVFAIALAWLAFAKQAIVLEENARLENHRATLTRQIQAASEAAVATAREPVPDLVRNRILGDARRLTGATHAALFHWDPDTGATRLTRTDPALDREASRACLRVAVRVQRTGQEIVSADLAEESLQELHATIGARSFAAIPWPGPKGIDGMLVLCSDRSSTFRGGTRSESFANLLAIRLYVAVVSEIWHGVTKESPVERIDTIRSTWQGVRIDAFRQSMLPVLDTVIDRLELLAFDEPALTARQRQVVVGEIQHDIRLLAESIEELHISDSLQRGSLVPQPVAVDAVAQAREILDQEPRSLPWWALHVEGDAQQLWVLADAGLFPHMLKALLRSAASGSAENEVIELLVGRAPGRVTFEVIDRGTRIAIGDLDRVREPLYRPTAGSRGRAGLGLALSILRGLVALHGGEVWLTNDTDVNRVGFWLPAAEEPPTIPTTGPIPGRTAALAAPFFTGL